MAGFSLPPDPLSVVLGVVDAYNSRPAAQPVELPKQTAVAALAKEARVVAQPVRVEVYLGRGERLESMVQALPNNGYIISLSARIIERILRGEVDFEVYGLNSTG